MRRLALFIFLWLAVGMVAADVPGQKPGLPAFPAPTRQWAVLVGVSKYLHLPESAWLDGCDLDATSLSQFLASPRGGAFPPDHIKLLVNEAATTTTIRLALDFLIKNARAGDVVYIFFACHGRVEVYGSGEVAYLMPYDGDPQHLNATALPMDEVRRYVDVNLRESQVVLITDACHAGGLSPTEAEGRHVFVSLADHLQNIGERNGALNIMACRRDESAVEDPRLGGHGVLTYCLLRALSGENGPPADGIVRAQDVLEYVMRQVPRLTNSQQHPRHSSNYHDEFPMAQLKLAGPPLDLAPAPSDSVASVQPASLSSSAPAASLRILGAPENSELYLVQGREQRTVGRALSSASLLILEGIPPGRYLLVQTLEGKKVEWKLDLAPGLHSFDVREGHLE